jgi:hypothetical protein
MRNRGSTAVACAGALLVMLASACRSDPTLADDCMLEIESAFAAEVEEEAAQSMETPNWGDVRISPHADSILTHAPRDSVVGAAFVLRALPQVFQEIAEQHYGAETTYVFRTFAAITIQVMVADLERLVQRTDLYSYMVVTQPMPFATGRCT